MSGPSKEALKFIAMWAPGDRRLAGALDAFVARAVERERRRCLGHCRDRDFGAYINPGSAEACAKTIEHGILSGAEP